MVNKDALNAPSQGAATPCTQPATQVCLPCNDHAQLATPTSHRSVCRPRADHAQPAADKAPTSVTEYFVKLIVV